MKNPIKKLFILLAMVMSFVVVQAAWAIDCVDVVAGTVTAITDTGEITVGDDTTVYGVPADWDIVAVGDEVVINVHVTNNNKFIACYLTVDEGEAIELRPQRKYRNKP